MAISFEPLPNNVGVTATGVNVGGLTDDDKDSLYRAFLHNGVMVFRDLALTMDRHVELSRVFGELEPHPIKSVRHKDVPEILELKSQPNIEFAVGWHTDLMYTDTPSGGAVLRPVVIPPEGGQTGWVDTARVFAALPDRTKQQIVDLRVVMSYRRLGMKLNAKHSALRGTNTPQDFAEDKNGPLNIEQFPNVTHPLVYKQPVTGVEVLNVSPVFAESIVGLPQDAGRALLQELQDFATREEFVYKHSWRENDLVVWNNWRTMHRAYPHDHQYPRILHRTTIKGGKLV